MLKYIPFILMFISSAVSAESVELKKPVICEKAEVVLKAIVESDYKEQAIWGGISAVEASIFSLFVNEKTKSWTILQIKSGMACIIGTGENFVFERKPAK